jgi:hypothetical protein
MGRLALLDPWRFGTLPERLGRITGLDLNYST